MSSKPTQTSERGEPVEVSVSMTEKNTTLTLTFFSEWKTVKLDMAGGRGKRQCVMSIDKWDYLVLNFNRMLASGMSRWREEEVDPELKNYAADQLTRLAKASKEEEAKDE